MVKLAYFLLTKVFEIYKDVYPSKIKFKFDTFFLTDKFSLLRFINVLNNKEHFVHSKKVSNLNFFFTMT